VRRQDGDFLRCNHGRKKRSKAEGEMLQRRREVLGFTELSIPRLR